MKILKRSPIWNGDAMLFKKMLRDIKKHKAQFLSIFLMAFLGMFVFAGVGAESFGLEANSDQFYEDTNLADGWIYSPFLNALFLEQVNLLVATTQMERQAVVDASSDFEVKSDIKLHFVENNTLSKFYLMEGEALDINDSDGVWLDKSFADAKGLKVGDNISFKFDGYQISKIIRGLGYSPEYVYHASTYSVIPDFNRIGFAYLSCKAFPSADVPYNVLNVKFEGTPEDYSDLLDYRLGGYYVSFLERSEHSSVSQFADQITLHKMMADVFPVVFILVSMLILLTTMTRIISHQRTQIGILKASGFKNASIILHYISYGVVLVLLGSILGLILGPLIVPPLIYSIMDSMFKLPLWNTVWSIDFVYVEGLMVLMALAVSLPSAIGISNEKPSESIKPKPPGGFSLGFMERFKFWQNLSFNIRWNWRDAKRNKFRAVMTVIGVMGCTILLVCALGLNDSMNDLKEWDFNQIQHYDTELVIDADADQYEIDKVAEEVNGDKVMKSIIELESPLAKKSGVIVVLDGTDLITPTDNDRNEMEIANDEVSISQKMADMLGVGIGDSVKWHVMNSNKWVNVTVDKIHADPNSQGLVMSKDKLEDLGLNYTPTSIVTAEHVDKNYSAIKSFTTADVRTANWDQITLAGLVLIYSLITFASVLAIIVLYNLGLLSFTEIEREIATLKILGFKTGDLRKLLLTQNLWFTAIGFVLGLPIGLYVLRIMWASSGDSYYVVPSLTITTVLLTGIITFALSIIVNRMFSGKIKKLDMVESLKKGE